MSRRSPRWHDRPFRALTLSLSAAFATLPALGGAQAKPAPRIAGVRAFAPPVTGPLTFDSTVFSALKWREMGPARGGRSVAVAGSVQRPLEYWMGTTGGGVFKSADGGQNWAAATDKYFGGTIGAIAVDPQNADVVWVGGGETDIRGNTAGGDGLWKTTDAGKTWSPLGFKEEHIAAIRIHPTNANVAWMAVFGNPFRASATRGVFKSTDGGKTFVKILFVNDSTGAIDIQVDPTNSDVLYAATWQAYRTSWALSSGGMGTAIYKSTDGGTSWTNLTKTAKGLPTGVIGKIGLAISPAKTSRLWAIIEHDSGGVYRSDDAGATWSYINRDRKLRQRAWYYSNLIADPKDTNVVYALNVGFYRSRDGGRTFRESINVPHPDNHDLWIAPNDPLRMIEANDGGATVSTNGGKTWTDEDFATAQMYHVDTNNDFPYLICGAQQDNSTLCGPSRGEGRVNLSDWKDAGGGESGYVTPHPTKPHIVFAGSYGGLLTRKDMRTGFTRDVTVYPINPMGYSSKDIKVRFQWTFPIVFSRHNPNVIYAAGSRLFRSTDEGESWTPASPELARRDPKTMDASGGPITKDQTGVETYALIFAFDESPVTQGVLWVGTDDGLVWLSKNNGASWENVTPKDIGDFSRISIIEPGHYDAGTAYVAANRFQLGDKSPLIYKTTDFGKSWTKIVKGIEPEHFLRVVREDPVRRGLLFAGTERGVYVSFDDGANWASLRKNLPLVPVHDLKIKDNDVIVATHGRSFWVLDDISALRLITNEVPNKAAHLFKPNDALRSDFGGGFFAQLMAMFGGGGSVGANPPGGAAVQYYLKQPNKKVTLEYQDASGKTIASFTSDQDTDTAADSVRMEGMKAGAIDSLVSKAGWTRDSATKSVTARFADPAALMQMVDIEEFFNRAPRPARVPNKAGVNTFNWNMRYPDAVRFDGIIMWAAGTTGPVAPPGAYTVKLTVDGETQSHPFRLRKDPRSDATDADLLAQFKLLIAIRDKTTEANNAVRTVRNMRWQVGDRAPKLPADKAAEFKRLSESMMGELSAGEQEVYQVKNQSSQDPLNYPIKLNNQIASLAGTVGSGEYRPTKQSVGAFDMLSKALDVQTKAIKRSMDDKLPRLNAILRAAGLQELKPSTEEIKKDRPNVAM
ncbi:MAG: glycosyl hydrolase [Gemmatimonadaceae bacterium]|nr:glycosyl hydrolase [Gemmatimonadaceae bacterium]